MTCQSDKSLLHIGHDARCRTLADSQPFLPGYRVAACVSSRADWSFKIPFWCVARPEESVKKVGPVLVSLCSGNRPVRQICVESVQVDSALMRLFDSSRRAEQRPKMGKKKQPESELRDDVGSEPSAKTRNLMVANEIARAKTQSTPAQGGGPITP